MIKNSCINILHLLILLLPIYVLFGQNKNNISIIENIYLHTDRSTYFIGEDLWYKAYNVNAQSNLLTDNSNVLYVELISPDSKIIARNKTNLEMGLGHGDFKLTDSTGVKPDVYQLRAYTNWNRNFGEDFVFKKNIEIIDVFDAHFNQDRANANAVAEAVVTENEIRQEGHAFQIDFFPEGGSLLENVSSVVGFKAVNNLGVPIAVEGTIFDSDNQPVTTFLSVHDGMGQVQIIPLAGKSYYAIVKTTTGEELLKDLPDVLKEGYSLSFKKFKGRNIVSVSTNQYTLKKHTDHNLKLVCKSKGVQYLESQLKLNGTTLSFELPGKELPEGICQITLYDSQSRAQSERLVFIEKGHDLNVSLKTDKTIYQPNEEVVISVNSTTISGEPQAASFSLSVTDMNGKQTDDDYSSNICSYFFVESDIRGQVHNPGHYFNPDSPKRLEHLDNLLLTQGWRDFIWKTLPNPNDSTTYKAEKGFTISGKVKHVFGKKALTNNNISLALMKGKNFNAFSTVTDSLGHFQFKDLMFFGKTNLQLSSRNNKGKFSGEIALDSIGEPPMETAFKYKFKSIPKTNTIVEHVYKKYVDFGIQPQNVLDEVEIVARKRNDIIVFHGIADNTYVADEETKAFPTVYELIQQKIPGISLGMGGAAPRYPGGRYILYFNRYQIEPIILVDGFPIVDKSELDNIYPDVIEKIEAIRGAQAMAYYGEEGSSGLIAIYTNRHLGNVEKKDEVSSIKRQIEGFYEARVFYEINLGNSSSENDKKVDARNTIYWEPYINPNKTGKETLNYYNLNVEAKVKISLEGITSHGIPVFKKAYYYIEY